MAFLHPLTQFRLQRDVEHLHALDPRATTEVLVEVAGRIGGMPLILTLLTEYRHRLTPHVLHAIGGDRFPPRPLRMVQR